MNRPCAPDLLVTARQLLLDELLPALPRELHYQARMIASAMITAARDQQLGESCATQERQQLQALLDGADNTELPALRRQLAAAIRLGQLDHHPQLHQSLRQINRSQLAINNPRAVRD
ncbi:DUF6285 domain-containing protein [Pseudomonas sp. MYb185]|uniref:DUF6285 domain-containing protein n=1 Tax=Pseudomonas sp. MYb185 TaxID=1848729 RepID=UPI000CFB9CD2|nr:DUF6285 domain-containing protein [Pseudomonas sp. MYb185]PRB84094.1 hypothetical protein CQ007_04515 [Pseudomonas sp. MYb185]